MEHKLLFRTREQKAALLGALNLVGPTSRSPNQPHQHGDCQSISNKSGGGDRFPHVGQRFPAADNFEIFRRRLDAWSLYWGMSHEILLDDNASSAREKQQQTLSPPSSHAKKNRCSFLIHVGCGCDEVKKNCRFQIKCRRAAASSSPSHTIMMEIVEYTPHTCSTEDHKNLTLCSVESLKYFLRNEKALLSTLSSRTKPLEQVEPVGLVDEPLGGRCLTKISGSLSRKYGLDFSTDSRRSALWSVVQSCAATATEEESEILEHEEEAKVGSFRAGLTRGERRQDSSARLSAASFASRTGTSAVCERRLTPVSRRKNPPLHAPASAAFPSSSVGKKHVRRSGALGDASADGLFAMFAGPVPEQRRSSYSRAQNSLGQSSSLKTERSELLPRRGTMMGGKHQSLSSAGSSSTKTSSGRTSMDSLATTGEDEGTNSTEENNGSDDASTSNDSSENGSINNHTGRGETTVPSNDSSETEAFTDQDRDELHPHPKGKSPSSGDDEATSRAGLAISIPGPDSTSLSGVDARTRSVEMSVDSATSGTQREKIGKNFSKSFNVVQERESAKAERELVEDKKRSRGVKSVAGSVTVPRRTASDLVSAKTLPAAADALSTGGAAESSSQSNVSHPYSLENDIEVDLESFLAESKLVFIEDRGLIPDFLFFAIGQMEVCRIQAEELVGRYKSLKIGSVGVCCMHCGGKAGSGRCYPNSARSLAHASTTKKILSHISKCRSCPPNVRNAVVELQGRQQPAVAGRHAARQTFFERVWERLHDSSQTPEEHEAAGFRPPRAGTQSVAATSHRKTQAQNVATPCFGDDSNPLAQSVRSTKNTSMTPPSQVYPSADKGARPGTKLVNIRTRSKESLPTPAETLPCEVPKEAIVHVDLASENNTQTEVSDEDNSGSLSSSDRKPERNEESCVRNPANSTDSGANAENGPKDSTQQVVANKQSAPTQTEVFGDDNAKSLSGTDGLFASSEEKETGAKPLPDAVEATACTGNERKESSQPDVSNDAKQSPPGRTETSDDNSAEPHSESNHEHASAARKEFFADYFVNPADVGGDATLNLKPASGVTDLVESDASKRSLPPQSETSENKNATPNAAATHAEETTVAFERALRLRQAPPGDSKSRSRFQPQKHISRPTPVDEPPCTRPRRGNHKTRFFHDEHGQNGSFNRQAVDAIGRSLCREVMAEKSSSRRQGDKATSTRPRRAGTKTQFFHDEQFDNTPSSTGADAVAVSGRVRLRKASTESEAKSTKRKRGETLPTNQGKEKNAASAIVATRSSANRSSFVAPSKRKNEVPTNDRATRAKRSRESSPHCHSNASHDNAEASKSTDEPSPGVRPRRHLRGTPAMAQPSFTSTATSSQAIVSDNKPRARGKNPDLISSHPLVHALLQEYQGHVSQGLCEQVNFGLTVETAKAAIKERICQLSTQEDKNDPDILEEQKILKRSQKSLRRFEEQERLERHREREEDYEQLLVERSRRKTKAEVDREKQMKSFLSRKIVFAVGDGEHRTRSRSRVECSVGEGCVLCAANKVPSAKNPGDSSLKKAPENFPVPKIRRINPLTYGEEEDDEVDDDARESQPSRARGSSRTKAKQLKQSRTLCALRGLRNDIAFAEVERSKRMG